MSAGRDTIDRILAVWRWLNWERLLLGVVTSWSVIVLYHLFEARATVIPAILANSAAVNVLGLAGAALGIGLFGKGMLERMDRKGEKLETYLQGETKELRLQVVDLMKKVDQLERQERRCQNRLTANENALRQAGLIPAARTDWGDLNDG